MYIQEKNLSHKYNLQDRFFLKVTSGRGQITLCRVFLTNFPEHHDSELLDHNVSLLVSDREPSSDPLWPIR